MTNLTSVLFLIATATSCSSKPQPTSTTITQSPQSISTILTTGYWAMLPNRQISEIDRSKGKLKFYTDGLMVMFTDNQASSKNMSYVQFEDKLVFKSKNTYKIGDNSFTSNRCDTATIHNLTADKFTLIGHTGTRIDTVTFLKLP